MRKPRIIKYALFIFLAIGWLGVFRESVYAYDEDNYEGCTACSNLECNIALIINKKRDIL